MRNGPQFVSVVIRNLEQRFGSPIDFYHPLNKVTDLSTGVTTSTYTSLTIRKALLLPLKITRGFLYDTAYLAAGNGDAKNFSFGALHDQNESSIVVRKKDMKGFFPQLEDHISWHAQRFDVADVRPFPDVQIYVLTVKRTQSCKEFYFRTTHNMCFDQVAVHS